MDRRWSERIIEAGTERQRRELKRARNADIGNCMDAAIRRVLKPAGSAANVGLN